MDLIRSHVMVCGGTGCTSSNSGAVINEFEKLLEEISYNIADMEEEKITIDEEYVRERFKETIEEEDLDRYIL